jgi:hypothetical protein
MSYCKFEDKNNVIHMPELYLGPAPGFDGEMVAAQLNEFLLCMRRGIRVHLEWYYKVVSEVSIDAIWAEEPTNKFDGRLQKLEDEFRLHPEIDAILMGAEALNQFLSRLVQNTQPNIGSSVNSIRSRMSDITYRNPNRLYHVYQRPIQSKLVQLVSWKG